MAGQGRPLRPRLTWEHPDLPPSAPAHLRLSLRAENPPQSGPADGPANLLLEGENESVLQALLPDWEDRLDFIYADPPFSTGKTFLARIGRGEDSRRPENWRTTEGYEDRWDDPGTYLEMLSRRLRWMHRLLSPTGSLCLHLDWRMSAYGRLLLDDIFGSDRLINEIVWFYHGPSPNRSSFKRKHDTLLLYGKSRDYFFDSDAVRVPYQSSTVETFASAKAGFGKVPDLARGKVPEDWWYFPVVARLHRERTWYPTQKPEALLERLVRASCPAGGVVGDFFVGSGTTVAVAERLGRGWIGCDARPLAIETTYRRVMLNGLRAPLEVWRAGARRIEELVPIGSIRPEEGRDRVELTGLGAVQGDAPDFPADVVLW
ncbi:MAG: DNA-methyltransferase, partial [Anaerolineales bacterium]